MYLHRKFRLNLSLSEITLLFDLSLYLDRTLAQRKAQRKAKSKVKVTHYVITDKISDKLRPGQNTQPSQPITWLILTKLNTATTTNNTKREKTIQENYWYMHKLQQMKLEHFVPSGQETAS